MFLGCYFIKQGREKFKWNEMKNNGIWYASTEIKLRKIFNQEMMREMKKWGKSKSLDGIL